MTSSGPGALQLGGDPVGPGVLPDDGVVVRAPRVLVPDQRGLALVGDAEAVQVRGGQALAVQRGLDHRGGPLPDLHRVVLDPAGLGQDLVVLELVAADFIAAVVEDHASRAGRALVHRCHKVGHRGSSSLSLGRLPDGGSGVGEPTRRRPRRPVGRSPRSGLRRLRTPCSRGVQHVADEQVVDDDADDAADQRPDDGYPEVVAEMESDRVVGPGEGHLSPPAIQAKSRGPKSRAGLMA